MPAIANLDFAGLPGAHLRQSCVSLLKDATTGAYSIDKSLRGERLGGPANPVSIQFGPSTCVAGHHARRRHGDRGGSDGVQAACLAGRRLRNRGDALLARGGVGRAFEPGEHQADASARLRTSLGTCPMWPPARPSPRARSNRSTEGRRSCSSRRSPRDSSPRERARCWPTEFEGRSGGRRAERRRLRRRRLPEIARRCPDFHQVIDLRRRRPPTARRGPLLWDARGAPPGENPTATRATSSATPMPMHAAGTTCMSARIARPASTTLEARQPKTTPARATASASSTFNGDGAAESVYGDESTFRVYDGTSAA